MDNIPQSGSSRYPRWLYPISILWGTLMGVLFYASATFPKWYTHNFGPPEKERGPFWDTWVFVDMMLTGLMSAAYFWLIMKKTRDRSALRWAFPLASVAIPVLMLNLSVIWWYMNSPRADVVAAIILWLLHGMPALICLAPFGLLSGVIFYAITKPKE